MRAGKQCHKRYAKRVHRRRLRTTTANISGSNPRTEIISYLRQRYENAGVILSLMLRNGYGYLRLCLQRGDRTEARSERCNVDVDLASDGAPGRRGKKEQEDKKEMRDGAEIPVHVPPRRSVSVIGLPVRLDAGSPAVRVWLMAIKRYLASTPSHLTSARTFKVLRRARTVRAIKHYLTTSATAAATYYNDIILAPPH